MKLRTAKPPMGVIALGLCSLTLACSTIAADVPQAVLDAEAQRIAVMADASSAALAIFSAAGGEGGGSGVIISPDGYAVSNFHVTSSTGDLMKCGMSDGRLYDAVIVGIDPTGDVALLKLLGRDDFPTATLGDSDLVRTGDWSFVVGNPFLLATDYQPTVTFGIISGVNRYQYPSGTILEYSDCIQTDASINPGNSGGPLFNADGELIGIVGRGSFEKRGRVNVGVGYAISINQVKNFLGHLRSGRVVDHASLGATVASDAQGRVIVTDILETSDAYRRGLRFGDEIVNFGGRPIRTVNAFKNVLGIFPQGWRIPLSYRRDGEKRDLLVRLQRLHSPTELTSLLQQMPGGGPPRNEREQGDDSEEPSKEPTTDDVVDDESDRDVRPADYVKKRTGYTNYYFNELERSRVWETMSGHGDFTSASGPWHLEGTLVSGDTFALEIDGSSARLTLPMDELLVTLTDDAASSLDPPGSGGLLVTLAMWRRMLVEGPEGFGQVYYLGSSPLPGHDGLADVLVGFYAGVECHFSIDPIEGDVLAVEMFPSEDVDPCSLLLSDYHSIGEQQFPHHIEIRHGDEVFSVLNIEKATLGDEEVRP